MANKVVGAKPGSLVRKVVEKTTGVSSVRLLPPYATAALHHVVQASSRVRIAKRQGTVAVFPRASSSTSNPRSATIS